MNGVVTKESQILEEVIRSGNIPVAGRSGMLCGSGGLLPPALLDEAKVPKFYLDALTSCGATTSSTLPNTALVYNLMVTSGLPKDSLAYIWSAVNRSRPGQLTRPEFFSLLALIALTQKGESLAALCTKDSLPIPYLNPVQAFPAAPAQPQQSVISSFPPFPTFQRAKSTASAFIPTSLLPRRSARKKKEPVDLIGEPTTTSTAVTSSAPSTTPKQSAIQDLGSLQWTERSPSTPTSGNTTPEESNIACWTEATHAIYLIYQEANSLVGKCNKEALTQLSSTEAGEQYLRCLGTAHEVMDRISKSAGVLLAASSVTEVETIRKCWKKLSGYVEYQSFMTHAPIERKCAICSQPAIDGVDFGGQTYDLPCANLWVNNVGSTLPNQHLK